jgi:hypothetical protein
MALTKVRKAAVRLHLLLVEALQGEDGLRVHKGNREASWVGQDGKRHTMKVLVYCEGSDVLRFSLDHLVIFMRGKAFSPESGRKAEVNLLVSEIDEMLPSLVKAMRGSYPEEWDYFWTKAAQGHWDAFEKAGMPRWGMGMRRSW